MFFWGGHSVYVIIRGAIYVTYTNLVVSYMFNCVTYFSIYVNIYVDVHIYVSIYVKKIFPHMFTYMSTGTYVTM